ncbi:beta/gamma crystallin-related protein [Providencia sp. Me31A]|uniref:beta/gamma crystallin-related protein n=1 Tax=Providencia sp. Me31A TaxID=3392637 RepID=UPI003D2CED5D
MKKLILLLVLFCGFAVAKPSYHSNYSRNDTIPVYICALSPFSEFYAEVGISEQVARQKAARRCELERGQRSIFCKAKDAKCSSSKLSFNDQQYIEDSIVVFTKSWQKGDYLEVSDDIPYLSRYHFSDKISSFIIPDGWIVRFYEGDNYTDKYHTETGGSHNTLGYKEKTRSIKIISR